MVTFNRYPALITAMLRRMCGLLAAAYFDDNLLVDIACAAGGSKSMLNWGYTTMGTPPKPAKSFPMQSHRGFLGAVLDLADVATEGTVTVIPKEATRRQVVNDIQRALADSRMTPGQAAKLRGRSQWVGTLSFGRLGRLGLAVLKAIQYGHRSANLGEEEKAALEFHMEVTN